METRIVEFTCDHGHLTHCNLPVDTSKYLVEQCSTCGDVVTVWQHARFRHVQPGAEARIKPTFVPNDLGAGDAVEQKRQRVKELHDVADGRSTWGGNFWMEQQRRDL
jgi:hypothetical protein